MGARMSRKAIQNLIVVSDLHCGCRLALCHPDGLKLDDGGTYRPSELQMKLWAYWRHFWDEWVPKVTRKEPYAVVVNGDAIDGVHHNSVTQITHNLVDQRRLAQKILEPVVERCAGRFYVVRGTEAHDGKSAQEMETLAEILRAVPDATGQFSRWELQVRVGHGLVDLAHHIGTTGSLAYETSAIQKELEQIYVECARWDREPPSVVVRSHRHRNAETRVLCQTGFATSCTTAGWQLKMLALDTPLPTVGGWTTMGSVKVGDVLFDEEGNPCTVVAAHPIHPGPESFDVCFSNGETIKACGDHLWETTAEIVCPGIPGRGGEPRPRRAVRTTKEILATLRTSKGYSNHHLDMPRPLILPDADLPIDPYVLGCWLGDGDSGSARLTADGNDAQHYRERFAGAGYALVAQSVVSGKCPRFSIQKIANGGSAETKQSQENLQRVLRAMGLWKNKHIPAVYLRASVSQRLGLLQGLMDTDGHPDAKGRAIYFITTSEAIRDGMMELLATLGIKFTMTQRVSPSVVHLNPQWVIRYFISPDILPVFSLPRKLRLLPLSQDRKTAQKSRRVHIRNIVPCQSVPMRCIAVDSPSSLYRVGRTMLYTHNTPFAYRVAGARVTQPQIGGTLVRCGDEEVYTRHCIHSVERPAVEECYVEEKEGKRTAAHHGRRDSGSTRKRTHRR